MFRDWWESARRQGDVLGALLTGHGIEPPATVLDCTCGIGTQALPLAARGYRVVGSDLSAAAVARARELASARNIPIRLVEADVRRIGEVIDSRFRRGHLVRQLAAAPAHRRRPGRGARRDPWAAAPWWPVRGVHSGLRRADTRARKSVV